MGWTAFLDACVLYPSVTRDLLLRGSEAYLYQVRWSPGVLEEARRNLIEDRRLTEDAADSGRRPRGRRPWAPRSPPLC